MNRLVPFSNGNEFLTWKNRNCDKCHKYENTSTSYKTANCPAAFDIDMGSICGSIRYRTAIDIGHSGITGDFVNLNDKCKMKK